MTTADCYLDWHHQLCVFLSRLGLGPDAEDLASEVLLRCWLAEREGKVIKRSYAYRAARNLATDVFRRRALISFDPYEAEDGAPQPWQGGQTDLSKVEVDAALGDLLEELTPRQAVVLLLRLDGLKHREIAQYFGTTVIASKQLMKAARAKTQRYLERTGWVAA